MIKTLFIVGFGKSGTSSLVGVLNAHPQCFILYEAHLTRDGGPPRRGRELIDAHPWLADALPRRATLSATYSALAQAVATNDQGLSYFGDKLTVNNLGANDWAALARHQTIFMVRDLRTWLCKNVVVDYYLTGSSVADLAVRYTRALIETFQWRDCLRISMEAFVLDNPSVVQRVFEFLGIPVIDETLRWWEIVGSYPEGSMKAAVKWWVGHDSSLAPPARLDTSATLKSHAFWDALLPIFDKYFLHLDGPTLTDEVASDIARLNALHAPRDLALEDLYERVESVSFGAGADGTAGHRSTNPSVAPFRIG